MSQEGRQYSREQRVLVIRHAGKSKKHKSIKIHASAGVANALPLVSTQPNATGFRSAPRAPSQAVGQPLPSHAPSAHEHHRRERATSSAVKLADPPAYHGGCVGQLRVPCRPRGARG